MHHLDGTLRISALDTLKQEEPEDNRLSARRGATHKSERSFPLRPTLILIDPEFSQGIKKAAEHLRVAAA